MVYGYLPDCAVCLTVFFAVADDALSGENRKEAGITCKPGENRRKAGIMCKPGENRKEAGITCKPGENREIIGIE